MHRWLTTVDGKGKELALFDSLPGTSVMSYLTMDRWSKCIHINTFSSLENELENWRQPPMKFSFTWMCFNRRFRQINGF